MLANGVERMALTASLQGNRIVLSNTALRDREDCKAIFGSSYKDGRWTIPVNWLAVKQLRALLPSAKIDESLITWCWQEYQDRILPTLAQRADALDPYYEETEGGPLYPYQKTGSRFLSFAGGAILADDMGTGKTATAIAAVEIRNAYPCLVVCPNSAKWNWQREWQKWGHGSSVQVISGTATQRRKQIASSADVYVINYESLRTHTKLAGYGSLRLSDTDKLHKELNDIQWKAVLADEAHRTVDPNAKQTRALWGVSQDASLRIAITGTPMVNTPDDLWSLLHFVAPDEWPGKTKYIDRYCIQGYSPFGGLVIAGLNPHNQQEFYDLLEPRFIRRTKAMVLPWLPPKVYERRDVEMLPKQRKAYDEFDNLSYANLDGGISLAIDPLTELIRKVQLASASAELVNGELRLCAPSNKVEELINLLNDMESSEPLVVFALRRQLLVLAAERLDKEGISYVTVWGNQSSWERQTAIDRFQGGGEVRVILCTLGAGSEAITLTAASTVCFLQRSWSMVTNRQAEDRVHRPGQSASQVTYIDFVAPGTVDEDILVAIEAKEDLFQQIVQDQAAIERLLA